MEPESFTTPFTFAVRLPTAADALRLVTDERFRNAVRTMVAYLGEWEIPLPPEVTYLRMRYQQGKTVKAIGEALQLSPYKVRIVAAMAHYAVWLALLKTAPDLADVLGSLEMDEGVQQ